MSRPRPTNLATGVLAALAVVACCALPLLVSAGLLTGAGAVLRSPYLLFAGLAAAAGAAGHARRRQRRRRGLTCGAPVPTAAPVLKRKDT